MFDPQLKFDKSSPAYRPIFDCFMMMMITDYRVGARLDPYAIPLGNTGCLRRTCRFFIAIIHCAYTNGDDQVGLTQEIVDYGLNTRERSPISAR